MSTRTVIEINHDFINDLLQRPETLRRFLLTLGSGDRWREGSTTGLRVLARRHHSDACEVLVNGHRHFDEIASPPTPGTPHGNRTGA